MYFMKLQMSLDRVNIASAMEILKNTHDVIDIVEVGTPFIFKEGLHAVAAIHAAYPEITILADTKIMDGGEYVATMAVEAGAEIVTVLAAAEDATIQNALKATKKMGKELLVDMIAIPNLMERAKQVDAWGVDYIGVHTGFDIQALGASPLAQLRQLTSVLVNAKPAVAGGIDLNTLPAIAAEQPAIVICGKSITRMPDPRQAILDMKAIIAGIKEVRA
jgi:3-hexulose-6-phosphate synthase